MRECLFSAITIGIAYVEGLLIYLLLSYHDDAILDQLWISTTTSDVNVVALDSISEQALPEFVTEAQAHVGPAPFNSSARTSSNV